MTIQKENLNPAERYCFEFQNSEPKYYTMVPNIVDCLTYNVVSKNGKITKKRLSVHAKELYRIIRMIASDDGCCFNTTKNLSIKMNCSVGSVVKAKKELILPMNELGGNPLIFEKKIPTKKNKNSELKSSRMLCTYTVFDIWKHNNAHMATLKFQEDPYMQKLDDCEIVDNSDTDSQYESVTPTDSQCESVDLVTDSQYESNKNPSFNKIPLFKQQDLSADAESVCFDAEKNLFFTSKQKYCYEWLIKEGCPTKNAIHIATKFTSEDLASAIDYTEKQIYKNKMKNNPIKEKWAYLQTALKKRYWENGNK